MVMSTGLQAIMARAAEYDSKLLATDPRFRRLVMLTHEDGSVLYFRYAFILIVDSEWVAVFTEHHGPHVYHQEDLQGYHQADMIPVEPM